MPMAQSQPFLLDILPFSMVAPSFILVVWKLSMVGGSRLTLIVSCANDHAKFGGIFRLSKVGHLVLLNQMQILQVQLFHKFLLSLRLCS